MMPGANLFNVQTGGTALDPASFVYDPSIVVVNTADFQNALAGGSFSTAFQPNGTGTFSVFVTFTPVPEPAEMMLIGAAIIGVWVWRRRWS